MRAGALVGVGVCTLVLAPVALAGTVTTTDFNGDGYGDLALGVPDEDAGTVADTGIVHVLYGASTGLRRAGGQILKRVATPAAARFGAATATGDFNRDGLDDLAVGAPGLLRVFVYRGSRDGLEYDRALSQGATGAGLPGGSERGDDFGAALAAGDFDFDGYEDLAIGVPGEDIGSIADAGAVNVVFGRRNGFRRGILLHQDMEYADGNGVLDTAEAADRFGAVLAAGEIGAGPNADLVVGVPQEGRDDARGSGFVHVFYGAPGASPPRGTRAGSRAACSATPPRAATGSAARSRSRTSEEPRMPTSRSARPTSPSGRTSMRAR